MREKSGGLGVALWSQKLRQRWGDRAFEPQDFRVGRRCMRVSRGPAPQSKNCVGAHPWDGSFQLACILWASGRWRGRESSYFPMEPWHLEALGSCRSCRGWDESLKGKAEWCLHPLTFACGKRWRKQALERSELGLLDQDLQYKKVLSTKDRGHLKGILTMVLCRKISQLTKVTSNWNLRERGREKYPSTTTISIYNWILWRTGLASVKNRKSKEVLS